MTAIPMSRARILLVISGGIAAYKSLELIRRLRDRGATVRVVMTAAAQQFISPLSAATLSGQPIRDELFSLTDEAAIGHIELSRAADLVVVAPASANILARMAAGLADDLATTLLLATDKRVLAAPAMNVRMWLHPSTRRNLDRLKDDGVLFVGPELGPMACGEFGPGRMAEPPAIVEAIEQALTAGPLGELPEAPPTDFGSAQRAAYHCHLRADIRADRPGPVHRKPVFGAAGTCNCAIGGWRRCKGNTHYWAGRPVRSCRG